MKSPIKKYLIWFCSGSLIIVLAASGYMWYLYHSVKTTANKMYETTEKQVYVSTDPDVKRDQEPVVLDERDPFTVLILGVDQRQNDHGRSDTMIVLSVNPSKKSILMFNIPRDSRTEIVGHGTVDKINHAYAFGNEEMSVNTVEQFLDYPIDYYVKVNMEGFSRIIDSIGGVEVDNPFTFTYEGHEFEKGHLSLNGDEALLYSRMRYDDPRGDIGRNARQREIMTDMMHHALKISNLTKVSQLLNEIGNSVKTNIKFDEMKTFVTGYRPDLDNISMVEVKGKGQIINKVWYYIVDESERIRIHDVLKDHQQS